MHGVLSDKKIRIGVREKNVSFKKKMCPEGIVQGQAHEDPGAKAPIGASRIFKIKSFQVQSLPVI